MWFPSFECHEELWMCAQIRIVGGILLRTLCMHTLDTYGLEAVTGVKFPGEPDFPDEPGISS